MSDATTGRRLTLTVTVRTSPEPIDFDAWAARYVRLLIEADRAAQRQLAEAA